MNIRSELLLDAEEMKSFCDISVNDFNVLKNLEGKHTFSTTKYYASLMNVEDENDPLKKMQLPMEAELIELGKEDTSNEGKYTKVRGLQHKYKNTALMLVSEKCAMYCRYCFRKRMVGKTNEEVGEDLKEGFNYVRNHKEIDNILFSGGDPLFQDAKHINTLLEEAFSIEHLHFVRFGSRIPVVMPMRIYEDQELQKVLKKHGASGKLHIVTQFNHPNELTEETKKCMTVLKECNITVRNQSVLLKGVNDDPEVLAELFNKLVAFGITPYYIYQCRPVKNVKSHFQLPLEEGLKIVQEARAKLNGIAKAFRYLMSTYDGKIEVVGHTEDKIYCKYNQAHNEEKIGKLFTVDKSDTLAWVDENTVVEYL